MDEEFLNEMPSETPIEDCELMKVHNTVDLFDNFSFVNESNVIST